MRRLLLTTAAGVLVACGGPQESPEPVPEPDDPARRVALREALRRELGADYDAPLGEEPTADALQRGAKTYDYLCASCHGRTGRGNGRSARMLAIRPPDLADPEQAEFFSERAKLHIVAEGLPGSPMIGWKEMLDEQGRLEVLLFMNSLVRDREGT